MPEKEYDYYKALQDQNYNTLLDKEIQLDSARQRALKNTNTNLAAAGFNSSGYGQTAKFGVENQYLQGLQNAEAQYQEENRNILNDQYNAQNNAYTGFMEKLSSLGFENQEDFNNYLTNRGFMNEDGTFNEEEFGKKFGAHNYNEFLADMEQYRKDFGDQQTQDENNPTIFDMKTAAEKAVKDELNFIKSEKGYQIFKNLKEGDCIMVSDNTEKGKSLYLKWQDGKFVDSTEDEYNSSKGKYFVASRKNSKDMNVEYNGKLIYTDSSKTARDAELAAKILATIFTGGLGAASFAIPSMVDKPAKEVEDNYQAYLKALKGNE